ncbi:efflux RND transporter periplasmic adaptor subunit [Desulfopila aestuarii]|uniref:RND family efflux transporter, MFP subunit n=1 Tax=Desulfopila aestuarii DSM 18488 TaxID=1121416 RepID=A0A1M7Y4D4_9BACT|nr:efflux RND transporter periplasmic adaptor subunit [Desulfopila aestuarii]SHO47155.1 RND family efflux transporter, MFP subunit [Desulfopila aestuarii DSM 18488]
MRTKMQKVVWLLAALALVFLSVPAMAADGPPPAKVVVGKVTQQEVAQTRSVIGVVYFERISDISTEVAGLVEAVKVNQGDHVEEGAPLVVLNTEILEQEIALTRTRIEQAQLRIDNTRKNFLRLQKLYSQSGVSEKEFDDAQYAYNDAQKEKQAGEDTLKKLQIQKQRSVITAPFAGTILTKDVDSGAWVTPGKQLLSLGSSEDIFVRAPVAENLLKFVELGSSVPVIITAFDKEITGKVVDIDPVADMKTKNIFMKIRIPAPEMVAQNMSATVHVPAGPKQQLQVLPRAAVVKFQGKDFVYTIKEGKAAILPVNIVTFMGESVAVDNPYIVPGMEVVVEGNERLRPDQPVTTGGEQK